MAPDAPKTSLLERVKAMATELGLEEEEATKYIDQHMQKAGWKRETNWLPPDGSSSDGKKEGGWF
jgi:hypothetical protein